jgi:hypothetical protein
MQNYSVTKTKRNTKVSISILSKYNMKPLEQQSVNNVQTSLQNRKLVEDEWFSAHVTGFNHHVMACVGSNLPAC